ncbi:hypothetical protein MT996_05600 [Ornithobacterium rhinotracheale]|uniref:hypothetical protein n=1 Tax=Ornithobacterium rhinotracheale TaxID=28251 RepID=UPI001FBBDCEE|nr:hypothetical protein [Ornithobacterium rhinotracheale]UOH78943.1 hypothetical protein MT996_05600 [Ornithobacterium rhinotracheale]
MKKAMKIFGLLLFMVVTSFALVSCSDDDDPADNLFFIGTYEGKVGYSEGFLDEDNVKIQDGKVTVVKAGDKYNFEFSKTDGKIPTLTGIKIKKGENSTIVVEGLGEGQYVRINDKDLTLFVQQDGKTWVAKAKRK